MRTPKTHCPNCNSRQSFPRLKRPTSLPLDDVQEVYVRCPMCRWEEILEYTTPELEQVQQQKRRAGDRGVHESRRHGAVTVNTHRMSMRLVRRAAKLRDEIDERVSVAKRAD